MSDELEIDKRMRELVGEYEQTKNPYPTYLDPFCEFLVEKILELEKELQEAKKRRIV